MDEGLLTRWSQVCEDLAYFGYAPWQNTTDREIAEEQCCPDCGEQMRYEGWSLEESYRAFAVCKPCNVAIEF